MKFKFVVFLIGLAFFCGVVAQAQERQTVPDSTTGTQASYASDLAASRESPSWLFPMTELDKRLPSWIMFGGEYRDRFEGPQGIGFKGTNDYYLLDRFRLRAVIQPKPWLGFHGEVQDARIFFNHHTTNGNPYEDSWTLWEAYPQIGSSTEGWVDVLAGRQVLQFGDERVIGPSNWTNVTRTFNVARIDFHHPGYEAAYPPRRSCPARILTYTTQSRATTCTESTEAFRISFPRPTSSPMFSGALHPRTLSL